MAEMVILQSENGSKVVKVACRTCGRISLQVLKAPCSGSAYEPLSSTHVCVVCGSAYQACSTAQAQSWLSAFSRYNTNPSAYNETIKENYHRQLETKTTSSEHNYTPLNEWKGLFSETILKRGEEYVRLGKVVNLSKTDSKYSAHISGTQLYHASIHLRDKRIKYMECTCPYAKNGDNCKHMAALLYAAETNDQVTVPGGAASSNQPMLRNSVNEKAFGTKEATDDIVEAHQDTQFGDAKLDNALEPVNVTSPPQSSMQNASGFEETASLEKKLNRWKKELLDTGKRNKMINYRKTKRTTLSILEPNADELFNKLAFSERELKFERPISKDTDFRTYSMLALLETLSYTIPIYDGDIKAEGTIVEREKTLRNLRSKTKLAREEQGTNILYLSFGFILWREKDKPNAQLLKSPLLMMPVSLSRKSLNAPFTISRYDDEIEVNPTLAYLFNVEYGIDLPVFELKDKNSFQDYLDLIEEIIDKRGWRLVREVSLGLLSFLKISMYHDLNNDSNRQRIMQNPVLRAIGGDYTGLKDLPSRANNFGFDDVNPRDWYQVVNSDSSQQEAIMLSKLGVSFVMQGPPGTGKSQTITNIIAEGLADNKKILFVSEKAAALQVVLKRLTEVGLDDFCLSLHNYKANKKEIIDDIGENLSLPEVHVQRTAINDLAELFRDRKFLNEYAEELHKSIEPLEESIYTAFGRISKLNRSTVIHFRIANPMQITKEQYVDMRYNIELFERALRAMESTLAANPWYKTNATSSGQAYKAKLMEETGSIVSDLRIIDGLILDLNETHHLMLSRNWNAIHADIEALESALFLPVYPSSWNEKAVLDTLLEAARREQDEQASYHKKISKLKEDYIEQAAAAKEHSERLTKLAALLHRDWNDSVLELDFNEIRGHFCAEYSWIYDNHGHESMLIKDSIQQTSDNAVRTQESIEQLVESYSRAAQLLSMEQIDTFDSMTMVADIISILAEAPYLETPWFDFRQSEEITEILAQACAHSNAAETMTAKISETWEPDVFRIDADGMMARFKTEYDGFLRKMKSSYREDLKTLKLYAKQVGAKITDEDAISLLHMLKELNADKNWFTANNDKLTAVFGKQYVGPDTNWVKLRYGVDAASSIARRFPYCNIPEEVINSIQQAALSIGKSAAIRQLSEELTETRIDAVRSSLLHLPYVDGFTNESGIRLAVIPQIQQFIHDCQEQQRYLSSIEKCFQSSENGSNITYRDITVLLDNIDAIEEARQWFERQRSTHADLFADIVIREPSDWDIVLEKQDVNQSKTAQALQAEFVSRENMLTAMFNVRYTGIGTDWAAIIEDLNRVKEFQSGNRNKAITPMFMAHFCDSETARDALSDSLQILRRTIQETQPKLDVFAAQFEDGDLLLAKELTTVAEKYSACMDSFDKLDKWIDYKETKAECDKLGLAEFTDKIAELDNTVIDVLDAFERGFFLQWISLALNQAPSVQSFRRRVHEQHLEKFVALDEAQFSTARDRIREKIIESFPDPYGMTGPKSDIGILRHEMEKKKRIMPLRKLFRTIPNLLITLKPCLMMSPLSVAYFLDADAYHFDMVIFDEASQIFPQDAVGAIFRANQVIIAGDTKQLPPTNFFAASTSNSDDFDGTDDDDWEDEIFDSILEETSNVLPNRTLLWHYRSKHEHLIAFSNQEIYKNNLVTFPSSTENEPDTGVEFIYVEDGYYEPSPRNYNKIEAARCVELVKEHIENHPTRSLGIIAFSEKQQQAISYEIQRFREQNPRHEAFFAEDKEDEFFVKNLENVQGDERDTIFFSVGYAKTKEQKANGRPMSMRFGPLGVEGGERRLNVAITRAKKNVKLVSSILPSDIDLSRTEKDGIRMLRAYIEFAKNGGATLAAARTGMIPDDFKKSIADFIRSKGYKIRESVGCSGYRIDIAVEHPTSTDRFVAGIECDGLSYAAARTARDRDRLRKSVLSSMGWSLYRIWSAEWYQNPEIEGQKLIEFIDKSIAASDEMIRRIEEQKCVAAEKKRIAAEKQNAARDIEEKKRLEEAAKREEEGRKKAEQIRAAREKKEKRAKHEQDKREAESSRRAAIDEQRPSKRSTESQGQSDTSWVKVGEKVKSKAFGIGTVIELSDGYISVSFGSGERKFLFPQSFDGGFLSGPVKGEQQQSPIIASPHQTTRDSMKDGTKLGKKDSLCSRLVAKGFTCIDNSATSSILWVLYSAGKSDVFEKIVAEYGMQYRLETRGSLMTNNKPAWRIMLTPGRN